jgi:hypothetical protein
MEIRRTYDTRVKYLVRAGLLSEVYRKQIHRSLISKWKREDPLKYYGYKRLIETLSTFVTFVP